MSLLKSSIIPLTLFALQQFFSQSNPLNNLNITSSLPPLLQRQNSAPAVQPQQQQQTQYNDFHKPNNVNRPPPITSASGQQQPDLQRKYSLPMSTTSASQPFVPQHQPPQSQSTITTSSSYNPPILSNMVRKQSAPAITSFPTTTAASQSSASVQQPPSTSSQQQQFNNNFQQVVHGSPSRARDRNLFDKVPLNQDALIQIQLPLLKGYSMKCSIDENFQMNYLSMRCSLSIFINLII